MTDRAERDIDGWAEKILSGDPQAVSRAITAVENRSERARQLLKQIFPHTGRATIIGITGPSGAGKSTLVDGLTALLRKQGKTVGILAVDPTSPFSGGAILGDRIRMQAHTGDSGAFIRSMATRGALGGLARATLDAALVLDAAGKDYILIETVGVGQDEVEIAKLADATLVVLVPGLGDDIQAFKAGIMEIADVFVVNKSDLPGAERVEREVDAALSLKTPASSGDWRPPIVKTVATRAEGVDTLLQAISQWVDFSQCHGIWAERRQSLWRGRLLELLRDRIIERVMPEFLPEGDLDHYASSVVGRATDPYTVVNQILEKAGFEGTGVVAPPNRFCEQPGALVLDHLGGALSSITEAVKFYSQVLGLEVSGYETIAQEKTKVAMIPVGDSRIELLEPTEADSPIGRYLAKRGPGLHHLCMRVPDLQAAIARLKQSGARLINPAPATGAGGHRYVFIHPQTAGGVLLELVEEPSSTSQPHRSPG